MENDQLGKREEIRGLFVLGVIASLLACATNARAGKVNNYV